MKNKLKSIVFKIAQLTLQDQRWILAQLTSKQKNQLQEYKITHLLQEAKRFRPLKNLPVTEESKGESLPFQGETLKNYCPLFQAIILHQGQFDWENLFFKNEENTLEIERQEMKKIKPATQKIVYQSWNKVCNFEEYMEKNHA